MDWGLRDYGKENVLTWGGKADCQHTWSKTGQKTYSGGTNSEMMQTHPRVKETHFSTSSYTCSICGAWKGQLGLEEHPNAFIEHLVQIFHEIKRVMKPSGSCWVVIGDTYYGGGGGHQYSPENQGLTAKAFRANEQKEEVCGIDYAFRKKHRSNWLQPKQKLLMPERFAIAMQDDAWLLRNTVIWHKVNPLPSSVRDRLTNSYESVFFFTKSPKYYFDLDAIRRRYPKQTIERAMRNFVGDNKVYNGNFTAQKHVNWAKKVLDNNNILGGNPGDVWSFTSEGFKDNHFATFPRKLVTQILKAACPKAVCVKCGKPTRVEDCGCGAGYRRGLVLDPFAGSGTTLLVAHKMGFDWLGIDINTRYCSMADKRLASHGKTRLDSFLVTDDGKIS